MSKAEMSKEIAPKSSLRHPEPVPSSRAHRGEPVVKGILQATCDELGHVGYRALRIEDVAARAGVNKTTIYRRWPNKADLVQETLEMIFTSQGDPPVTGSIRVDLLAIARGMIDFFQSSSGRVLVRMAMIEEAEDDLRTIIDTVCRDREHLVKRIVESAKDRGELRADLDVDIFLANLVGGFYHRIFLLRVAPQIDPAEHVDQLLRGAMSSPEN